MKQIWPACLGLLFTTHCEARLGDAHKISPIQHAQACGDSKPLSFDVVAPINGTPPYPAVLLVHGGGWSSGGREHYHQLQTNLAALGLVTVNIDYRLLPEARFPTQIGDVKCAVRWLRHEARRYRVNSERIAAIGGSAGAHLVGLLGTTPGRWENMGGYSGESSQIRCMVLHGGPTDLLYGAQTLNPAVSRQKKQLALLHNFLGVSVEQSPEQYRSASPYYQATQQTPPTLLIHGQKDEVVPVNQSIRMAARLSELGIPHETLIIPDAGHSDFGKHDIEARDRLLGFLWQCLN